MLIPSQYSQQNKSEEQRLSFLSRYPIRKQVWLHIDIIHRPIKDELWVVAIIANLLFSIVMPHVVLEEPFDLSAQPLSSMTIIHTTDVNTGRLDEATKQRNSPSLVKTHLHPIVMNNYQLRLLVTEAVHVPEPTHSTIRILLTIQKLYLKLVIYFLKVGAHSIWRSIDTSPVAGYSGPCFPATENDIE